VRVGLTWMANLARQEHRDIQAKLACPPRDGRVPTLALSSEEIGYSGTREAAGPRDQPLGCVAFLMIARAEAYS
jgi:hypothetical protein